MGYSMVEYPILKERIQKWEVLLNQEQKKN